MTPGLFGLLKLASASVQERLDHHFDSVGNGKKWDVFKKNLRSKAFAEAAKSDPRADDKLKKFVEMVHLHKTGKGQTVDVKGDSGKRYQVKFHSSRGIYSCSCPDWTIVRSQSGAECKHIRQLKSQSAMVKKAALALRSIGTLLNLRRIQESNEEQAWHAGQVNKIHKNVSQESKLRRMG